MDSFDKDYQQKELAEQILVYWRLAALGAPIFLTLLTILKFIFKIPFSNWALAIGIYFLLCIYLLRKIKTKKGLILTVVSAMIACPSLLYFFLPFIINYFGGVVLLAFIFNIFFIENVFNVSLGRIFLYIFLAISSLTSTALIFLEYYGVYPQIPGVVVNNYFLRDNAHLAFSLTVFIIPIVYFTFHIDSLLNILRKKIEELRDTRSKLLETKLGLEEKVKERTSELEEARDILEIKVRARTKEFASMAESLEAQVKERTKELEEKVTELEKFNKLARGRELRFKELEGNLKEIAKNNI